MKVTDWWKKYVGAGSDLLYDPSQDASSPLWDQLQDLTNPGGLDSSMNLSGIRPSSTDAPADQGASPHQVDLSELLAIQQSRTKGFNVFDIRPFHVTPSNFPLQIPYLALIDKVGHDGDGDTLVDPQDARSYVLKTWSTIAIPTAGNFLRIDFLPSKMNRVEPVAPSAGQNLSQFHEDQTYSSQTPGNNAPSQGPESKPETVNWFHRESSRVILIQFDDPNGPIIIARHGDVFDCPFNQIFVSFKTGCAPFSVITGYNTRIISTQEQKLTNMNLALSPGHGMFEWPNCHAVPFTVNANFFATGVAAKRWARWQGSAAVGTAAGVQTETIIKNQQTLAGPSAAQFGGGMCVVWITGINFWIRGPLDAVYNAIGCLNITQDSDNANAEKMIACPLLYQISRATVGTTAHDANPAQYNRDFPNPIRVVLKAGQGIHVTPDFSGSTGVIGYNYWYEIHGYTWGPMTLSVDGNSFGIPPALTTNGYPLDYVQRNSP